MHCKRARREIALGVGSDLDGAAAEELERHLAECPECRRHRREMEASLDILQTPSAEMAVVGHDSVWPDVSRRLPARRHRQMSPWIPTSAAAVAACLMVVVFVSDPRPQPHAPIGRPPLRVQQSELDAEEMRRLPNLEMGRGWSGERDPRREGRRRAALPDQIHFATPPRTADVPLGFPWWPGL